MKVSNEIRDQLISHYIDEGPEGRLKLALTLVVPCREFIEANGTSEDPLDHGDFLLRNGIKLLGRATLEGEDLSRLPVSLTDLAIFEQDPPNLPALLRAVRDIMKRLRAAETDKANSELKGWLAQLAGVGS